LATSTRTGLKRIAGPGIQPDWLGRIGVAAQRWHGKRGIFGPNALMKRFIQILLGVVLLIVIGGAVLLGMLDIPAPTQTKEIVLPNDRLPR
jgi:hypothetical protein